MAEKTLLLYTLSTCSYCHETKRMLNDLEMKYEYVDVDLLPPDEREEVLEKIKQYNPRITFPTAVYGDQVVVGMKLQELRNMLGVRTRVDELYNALEKIQAAKGYYFNRDREKTFQLLHALLTNRDRYGYMSCPCRLAAGDREKDKDIICPCIYRKPDVEQFGSCYCNLYVSREWNEGSIEHQFVPERRPA